MSAALPLTIGFIGLGVMGVPMARHLSEAGHRVQGFDVAASALQRLQREVPHARPCADARSAAADADVVFTMLPNGRVVHDVVCAADGVAAGLPQNYVKAGDARVVAHTKIIGGGESDSVSFAPAKLATDGSYTFFCSFPGHSALMKGTLKLVK